MKPPGSDAGDAGSGDAGSDDAGSDDAGSDDAGSDDAGSDDAGSDDDDEEARLAAARAAAAVFVALAWHSNGAGLLAQLAADEPSESAQPLLAPLATLAQPSPATSPHPLGPLLQASPLRPGPSSTCAPRARRR